jgi:hypothetical protein
MPEKINSAAQERPSDSRNSDTLDAPTLSFSSVATRWVGGSVGHVFHTGNARFVGGCAGSVRGF